MTDPYDEEQVRALLASARVEEPMPEDVAARLDATLAGLHREDGAHPAGTDPAPSEGRPAASVVPLYRRVAPRLLAAAAAVAVLGGAAFGVGQVLQDEGTESMSTAGSADAEDAPTSARPSQPSPDDQRDFAAGGGAEAAGLPVLRPGHLSSDIARVLAQHTKLSGDAAEPGLEEGFSAPGGGESSQDAEPGDQAGGDAAPEALEPLAGLLGARCLGPAAAREVPGVLALSVQYDARPAALVLFPAGALEPGRRVAEVWSCSGADLLARTMVPAGR